MKFWYVPDTVRISPLLYHWLELGRSKRMLESESGDLPKIRIAHQGVGDEGKVPSIGLFSYGRAFFIYKN